MSAAPSSASAAAASATALLAAFVPFIPLLKPDNMVAAERRQSRQRRPTRRGNVDARIAQKAVQTFDPAPFKPHPFVNPNLQTIVANFYPRPEPVEYSRVNIRSADKQTTLFVDVANGKTLAPDDSAAFCDSEGIVHVPEQKSKAVEGEPSKPVAVVLHGLESNSEAVITLRIVNALLDDGYKVCVLNFRSCAKEDAVPTTLRLYHAAFTEDVETVLSGLRESAIAVGHKPPEVYLCGFSLGGNVVCQFLGKKGEKATRDYSVVGAAAACVPFDLKGCQNKVDSGWRGVVYSRYLVESLQKKFKVAAEAGVDTMGIAPETVARADRIGLMDDAYITRVFGFKDRFDYYEKADARKVLRHIAVPTLIINAKDDPFFNHKYEGLPTQEMIGNAPVLTHFTENGGHCGFLDKPGFQSKSPCYFMREFARFFVHVREMRDGAIKAPLETTKKVTFQ